MYVQLFASCEKLLHACYVLQSYCTVSTNRSTLGSTDRSTEEVPVGTEKVQTLFFGAYRTYDITIGKFTVNWEIFVVKIFSYGLLAYEN